jgi:hypothetical protein
MSRGRPTLTGLGIGLGAAGMAGAAGAARLIADRIRRREDAQLLPEYASLIEAPTRSSPSSPTTGSSCMPGRRADRPRSPPTGAPSRPSSSRTAICLTSECWVLQRRALRRAGYRVVTWDQRGHGRSGKGSKVGYHIDQLGEDLYAVIQAAAPEGDLALGGHSMGGMTIDGDGR